MHDAENWQAKIEHHVTEISNDHCIGGVFTTEDSTTTPIDDDDRPH